MSDVLKLENQLCHRFYLISNAFNRAYRPLLNELCITYPQYIVLMALWENDNVTINSLLQKTGVDGGAMSLILKKLELKHFLRVLKDKQDKRVKRVVLTDKGHDAKKQAEQIPAKMLCKFDGMTVEEGKELRALLDKLQGCMDLFDEE